MELLARRFDTDQTVRLEIADGRIARVTAVERRRSVELPRVAPGLIDLQVNGYRGTEFNSPELTPEKIAGVVRVMDSFGVTRFCPTLTTEHFDVLHGCLRTIAEACRSPEIGRRIAGIHLEGPYISSEDGARGAHPREHCREPDWDEFERLQAAADGRIRILTMGVELDAATDFIRRTADSGVIVAIGHTAANPAQIRAAVDAGARMSTHLGNGSHPTIHRLSNYIWPQLADDRLVAGLIADGHHLPPEVVKTFVRAKTPERCILVSDLVGPAGMPPGRYGSSLCDVEVLSDGKLVIAGQRELLAGASRPIGTGIANVMHYAEIGLDVAVRMAVDHPAELLGIEPGGLQPGDPGDLVLFDLRESSQPGEPPTFEVRATLVGGEPVFGRLEGVAAGG
ncbi:MAG: amidohydrolase family protein [Candidatus Nealsonbacteria bacterium]|nr:amidohydrolase family protein [Candidatus Nealsonbacteria bacterium]